MSEIAHDDVDNLFEFLTIQFENLPQSVNNEEFFEKFDKLLGITLNKGDITKLKTFVQFSYNKLKNRNYGDKKDIYNDKKDSELKHSILEQKVKELEKKIAQLENQKIENQHQLKLSESDKKELIKDVNRLNLKIGENINKISYLTIQNQDLQMKLINNEIDFKNKSEEFKTNITQLQNKNEKLETKLATNEANFNKEKEEHNKSINELKENFNKEKEELKNNISVLENKLKNNKNTLESKIKILSQNLEETMAKIVNQGQEIIKYKKIGERDNYNAIIYIIILSSKKYSFEEIYRDIKEISKNIDRLNIKEGLKALFHSSNQYILDKNSLAHECTNKNIINELFPDIDTGIKNLFIDEILNETKSIIRGLRSYILNGKKDTEFEEKMKTVCSKIEQSFNKK